MGNESDNRICQWMSQARALSAFAEFQGKTQTASHIKPLHWYVACRLVIEGGFNPDHIVPRPPFRVKRKGRDIFLHFDPTSARGGEQTILGGLKTKNVDVVVSRPGIGPVLAVSCKGVTGAFRNLTNRMEETIGECTNLHITYPAMALGYLVLLRANRVIAGTLDNIGDEVDSPSREIKANDVAISDTGSPVATIVRFHNALRELVGRQGIRDEVSRYEAIGFGMVEMHGYDRGRLLDHYPEHDSPLRFERFFSTLYARYDERFVVSAPDLAAATKRLVWDSDSPAFTELDLDYAPRID